MLTAYAELVKMTGQYAEMHYIPEIEFVISELRDVAGWISVEERMPPACTSLLAYGWKYGSTGPKRMRVFESYISTHPRECVEDEEITHWMPLPEAPVVQSERDSLTGEQP